MEYFEKRAADVEAAADAIIDMPLMQRFAAAVLLQAKARRLIADMLVHIRELEQAHG